jgi:hypothetical protein
MQSKSSVLNYLPGPSPRHRTSSSAAVVLFADGRRCQIEKRRSRAGWLPDPVDNVRSEDMSYLNSGMVEESVANHGEPLHHGL